jgi:hypothetical protein
MNINDTNKHPEEIQKSSSSNSIRFFKVILIAIFWITVVQTFIHLTNSISHTNQSEFIILWLAFITFVPMITSSILIKFSLGYSTAKSISFTFLAIPVMAVINYALYIVIEFIKNPMVID